MDSCVITGMGIIASLGLTVDEFWHRLLEGEQAIEGVMIPGIASPIWQSRVGDSFNPKDVVDDPRVLRNASRFT
ncbi:MAG TPA: beta-ketoacyl-[acyl-carrier-protein] synthase II, partial [Sulfobacillus sp.]|nr:beta-ketoacyl-[acyl-carrier-protein] synthase II [Sulfobacillus sp.]